MPNCLTIRRDMMTMIKNDPDFELAKPGSFIYNRVNYFKLLLSAKS